MIKLRMEHREATTKAEKLQKEIKTIKEQRIIAGLYDNPLLRACQQEEAAREEAEEAAREEPEERAREAVDSSEVAGAAASAPTEAVGFQVAFPLCDS